MKRYFTLLFLMITFLSHGQLDSVVSLLSDSLPLSDLELDSLGVEEKNKCGRLNIYQDSYYEAVEEIQKKINKENCPKLIKGFRVQVFSCSGGNCKAKADKYYNQFIMAYPDLSVYKMWQPPSLKVRAGNCRSRFEAHGIKKLIESDFPFVFIVPDHIETDLMLDCDKMILSNKENLEN